MRLKFATNKIPPSAYHPNDQHLVCSLHRELRRLYAKSNEGFPLTKPAEPGLGEKWEAINALKTEDVWAEYTPFDRESWRDEVAAGNTNLGYWDWVWHEVESATEDAEE